MKLASMRALDIHEVPLSCPLDRSLYHESGRLLIAADVVFGLEHLRSLEKSGIRTVYQAPRDASSSRSEKTGRRTAGSFGKKKDTSFQEKSSSVIALEWKGTAVLGGVDESESDSSTDADTELKLKQFPREGQTERRRIIRINHQLGAEPPEVGRFRKEMIQVLLHQVEDSAVGWKTLSIRAGQKRFHDSCGRDRLTYGPRERRKVMAEFQDIVNTVQACYDLAAKEEVVDLDDSMESVERILALISRHRNLLLAISVQGEEKECLGRHVVRVGIVSVAMAKHLGWNLEDIQWLALSALLMDLGMTRLPKSIREEAGAYDAKQKEEVQKHCLSTLDILRHCPAVTEDVLCSISQHHERADGSGYPAGRKGDQIHAYAQVLSLVDVFCALSTWKVHRLAHSPYRSMEEVLRMTTEGKFSSQAVKALLASVSLYPIGSWVELSGGEMGRVIATGDREHDRPVISLLVNSSGVPFAEKQFVNLARDRRRSIERIFEPSQIGDPTLGF
ncbi:MAG: HD domain-containing phosphohydrolase [Planctomycetota bacterium]|jgi:HD-GYP domain-containing protein (c-di-GMP phosphodiesterase class II)|nr:HD domain-containing phosphohydrolase [Planctomycetota bacterium]